MERIALTNARLEDELALMEIKLELARKEEIPLPVPVPVLVPALIPPPVLVRAPVPAPVPVSFPVSVPVSPPFLHGPPVFPVSVPVVQKDPPCDSVNKLTMRLATLPEISMEM